MEGAVKTSALIGTASVQADKVVNVRMSESEHTLLKPYYASLNRSMQDVLLDFALMQIHKQRFCCRLVRSLKTPEFVSLVLAMSVITSAMQRPARLVKLNCFISPAKRYVNWLLRNRLLSSTSTAAASRLRPGPADRISTRQ